MGLCNTMKMLKWEVFIHERKVKVDFSKAPLGQGNVSICFTLMFPVLVTVHIPCQEFGIKTE